MKLFSFAAIAAAFLTSVAVAQTTNVHDGNWEVTIQFPSKPIVGDLVISGDTGTFKTHFGGGKTNACGGKETPIVVRTATPDELKFTLEYSKVLNGCRDFTLTTRRVNDVTLKGQWPAPSGGTVDAVLVKKK